MKSSRLEGISFDAGTRCSRELRASKRVDEAGRPFATQPKQPTGWRRSWDSAAVAECESTIRFELWWRGFALDIDEVRSYLVRTLEKRLGGFGVTKSGSTNPSDVADEVEALLRSGRIRNAVGRLLLRRLGHDFEAFITGIYALTIFVLGGEPAWDDTGAEADDADHPSPREAVARLMGLDLAATDATPDGTRLLDKPVDVRELLVELRETGALDLRHPSAPIGRASPEELLQARADAYAFTETFSIAVRAIEHAFARDFAGFGIFTVLKRIDGHYFRILTILAMLVCRRAFGGEGIDQIQETLNTERRRFDAYLAIIDHFPQYARYYRFDQDKQLSKCSESFVDRMRSDVAEYLDKNPDIKTTLNL